MGFATGSSSFLHHSLFLPPSSPCILQPPFSPRNGLTPRKNRTAISCSQQEITPKHEDFCKRRAILFVGFSLIPLLNMRAEAVEGIAAESTEVRTLDQKQKAEQSVQGKSSQNPFLSLLNGLGFLGSGVLAALYASLKKEKAASDATIESINVKLKEKEATINFLEKKFESELLNEKEARNKALAKANEEKQSLVNQLDLANRTITNLGQDLRKEKSLVEEQTIQVESLEVSLQKAGDEKRELQEQLKEKLDSIAVLQERINLLSSEIKDKDDNLQTVNSKLVEREIELSQLSSIYQQAQEQLSSLNSEIQQLKDILGQKENELELKNAALNNLKAELTSSLSERDESNKKLDAVLKEYDQFKSSAEKKAASDAKLLGEREEALHQLEEQLKVAKDDVNKSKVLISDLTQEKDNLTEMLNIELKNVKQLEQELKITQESLENSRYEVSDLAKQLEESRLLCLELEAKVSRIQVEFSETRDSLQREVNEVKLGAELIAGELRSTKELLSKSNDKLQLISQELAAKVQRCESLEKELAHTHRKAENAALALEMEKNVVSSLNKELKALESQISRDREARKSLEADLEDATKSLDEMNQETLKLSRELELAGSRISSMEDEKEALYRSLDEQKQVTQEARENLEDAHNLIMRLGNEREGLEKRGKKLEEELASAKGEILRLRSQMNAPKNPAINQHEPKLEVGSKSDVPPRRVTRRRKVNQQQEDS
ncbi:MAR-binding filament-like protein 1-1 [Sesamum alatum]|uniref:MAR-binding filament-like protein 1-1 n=1 Tax=Sesamum alatum TaxID=300844 RepID=A0AAE1XL06_9LAMI|nr:MAR-binding filament-like protein 1-1 [Sesamum alatum]